MKLTKDLIIEEKNKIIFPSKIFIDGRYQESISGKKFGWENNLIFILNN